MLLPRIACSSALGALLLAALPSRADGLPAAEPSASAELDEVVVKGYRVVEATTATKTDTPISDIPQSIQVVPLSLLKDRGVTRIDQIVDTVSGVHAEANYGGNASTFFSVRGFTSSSGLRDGFRNYGYFAARDIQAIERVEVLKGPSSVLYGASASLGGYINTVSKRPEEDAFTDVAVTAGSYALFRTTLDANRALNDSGSLSGRLNVATEQNDTFRDTAGYNSYSVAPSLAWKPDDKTRITALFEYNYQRRQRFDFGLPYVPQVEELSRTRYYGLDRDYGRNKTSANTLILERQLNEDWQWREAAHYTWANQRSSQTFPDIASYDGGNSVPYYNYSAPDETSRDAALQSELIGKLQTGPIPHQLLVGIEAARTSYAVQGSPVYFLTIDLYDPANTSPLELSYVSRDNASRSESVGVYLQDSADLTSTLKLLAGVRADWFATTSRRDSDDGLIRDKVSDAVVSPRAGLLWKPLADTSAYFNWSRAFAPVLGSNAEGGAFNPENARQYEVGVKQSFLANRLGFTLAWFDLVRNGILTANPENPAFFIQLGEQRSRGVEFDLAGEPLPGLKLVASYAYTSAKVVQDNVLPEGDRLADIPRHSGSVWGTYRIRSGALRGLGFGTGVFYIGSRAGNLPNTLDQNAYWRVDTSVYYERRAWKLQLSLLNALDEKYFTGGSAGVFNYTVNPSAPASLQGSLSYRF
ncbi:TonB-dependent siderophore receptor [Nevskia ramosa]|uniref:TonB-dependent siderophore receptor n=1 Tax=Nevskia ramosa TaxID=64002 RepID=UPI003D0D199A